MKAMPKVSRDAKPSPRSPVSLTLAMSCLGQQGLAAMASNTSGRKRPVAGTFLPVTVVGVLPWCPPCSCPGDLTQPLSSSPSLGPRGTSSIPDILILLPTWHKGLGAAWEEEEAGQGLAGLLCPCWVGEGREDTTLHLTLQPLGA